jgi:hypothetical protein
MGLDHHMQQMQAGRETSQSQSVQQVQVGRDITGGAHGPQAQLGRICQGWCAVHLGRLEGVIRREVNLHHKDTARVWAIGRSAA